MGQHRLGLQDKDSNSEAIASGPKHDSLNTEDDGNVLSQKLSFQTL
jgi:hypothetical protein